MGHCTQCKACQKSFQPRAQTPGQQFCSAPSCQRERKRLWQKKRGRQIRIAERTSDEHSNAEQRAIPIIGVTIGTDIQSTWLAIARSRPVGISDGGRPPALAKMDAYNAQLVVLSSGIQASSGGILSKFQGSAQVKTCNSNEFIGV